MYGNLWIFMGIFVLLVSGQTEVQLGRHHIIPTEKDDCKLLKLNSCCKWLSLQLNSVATEY